MSLRNYLKGIADALRDNGAYSEQENGKINAQEFSTKIYEVAEVKHTAGMATGFGQGQEIGYANGHEEGYTEGIEQGKQAECDAFWESFQKGGIKRNYTQTFFADSWTDITYNPKYPIICTSCTSAYNSAQITDTKVDIDVSGCTATTYLFGYAGLLQTVKKLIVSEKTAYSNTFAGCGSLTNIVFEGTIANSLSITSSVLSVDSAKSIINCLKNFTGTENEGTFTLKFNDVVWTNLEATTPPDGYTSWRSYTDSKGWST